MPGTGVPPGYPDFARNAFAGEIHSYSDVPPKEPPSKFSKELNQRLIHGYHASTSYTDRNIGVLLDALESSGVAENTIVALWADHGWKLGDHGSWCKHTNFEVDTRVPLIIRHMGICTARGETTAPTELIDLYPTLCELCGIDVPRHVQGRSFLPVLEDPKVSHRVSAYSSYPHTGHGQRLIGHSIRTDQYRYTEWWSEKTDQVYDSVLTDLQADPKEVTAVKDDGSIKPKFSRILQKRVHAARQAEGLERLH